MQKQYSASDWNQTNRQQMQKQYSAHAHCARGSSSGASPRQVCHAGHAHVHATVVASDGGVADGAAQLVAGQLRVLVRPQEVLALLQRYQGSTRMELSFKCGPQEHNSKDVPHSTSACMAAAAVVAAPSPAAAATDAGGTSGSAARTSSGHEPARAPQHSQRAGGQSGWRGQTPPRQRGRCSRLHASKRGGTGSTRAVE